ncbi:MAG: hypothetical protein ABI743_03945 [bacterium]
MSSVKRQMAVVQPGNRIVLAVPDLAEGSTVEVFIMPLDRKSIEVDLKQWDALNRQIRAKFSDEVPEEKDPWGD